MKIQKPIQPPPPSPTLMLNSLPLNAASQLDMRIKEQIKRIDQTISDAELYLKAATLEEAQYKYNFYDTVRNDLERIKRQLEKMADNTREYTQSLRARLKDASPDRQPVISSDAMTMLSGVTSNFDDTVRKINDLCARLNNPPKPPKPHSKPREILDFIWNGICVLYLLLAFCTGLLVTVFCGLGIIMWIITGVPIQQQLHELTAP